MMEFLKRCKVPDPYHATILIHDPKTVRNTVLVMILFLPVNEMLASMVENTEMEMETMVAHPKDVQDMIDSFCSKSGISFDMVVGIGLHWDCYPLHIDQYLCLCLHTHTCSCLPLHVQWPETFFRCLAMPKITLLFGCFGNDQHHNSVFFVFCT